MKRRLTFLIVLTLTLLSSVPPLSAQQMADPEFKTVVEKPTFSRNYPRVLFDEAHNNFHTTSGRYKPFVELISSDGFNVTPNLKTFSRSTLDTYKILIIANALGAEDLDDEGADGAAFSESEADVVHKWVKSGGALLLIADHAPFGGAAQMLASKFGVEMSKGFVYDTEHSEPNAPSTLIYSRENQLLLDHPLTRGRDADEKVSRVVAFTGQALKFSEPGSVFLKLGSAAQDRPTRTAETGVSVGGQAQGLAFKYGKGRVIVLGEAAMLSAQITGPEKRRLGMNVPGNDNRQLALNMMHWLAGVLK